MICSCNNVQHLNYLIPLFVHHSLLLGVTLRLAAFSLLLPARSDPATSATRFLPEVSARLCRLFTYLLTYLLTGRINPYLSKWPGDPLLLATRVQKLIFDTAARMNFFHCFLSFFLSVCLRSVCVPHIVWEICQILH